MEQTFGLSDDNISAMLSELAGRDRHIKAALDLVGIPPSRRRPHGFDTVLSTIVSQQLSVKAAASIFGRVKDLMNGNPTASAITKLDDETLRGAGLSRQKISYVRSLSDAVHCGTLDFDALPEMDDICAIEAITSVKGLGVWSAQMYLMFALGRQDIWPILDLGVQEGAARLIGLDNRPKPKELEKIGENWRPYRSTVALLSWHYYSNAPL